MRSLATLTMLPAAALLAACPVAEAEGTGQDDRNAPDTIDPLADTDALIRAIEERIVMPEGAEPLESYTRYYSRYDPNSNRSTEGGVVFGLLEQIEPGPRVARWMEEGVYAPMDGGCSVITLRYRLATDTVEDIRCNGEA